MTSDRDLPAPARPHDAADDWLEGILVADGLATRDTYIVDDGFAAKVMQSIPALPAAPTWRKPAVIALWGTAAAALAVAMPGPLLDVAREGYRIVASTPVSLPGLAGAALALFALSGAAAAYALRAAD